MVQRGLVYRNRMINTGPTNAKIYDRCVRLIAELSNKPHADAETCLLRAVYQVDALPDAVRKAPVVDHIRKATPAEGAEQLEAQVALPVAILLACSPPGLAVADALAALRKEPRVSVSYTHLTLPTICSV